MPNGNLTNIYQTSPLGPGKNIGQARFMMANCYVFKKLENEKRVKIIYENLNILSNSQTTKLEENFLSLIR